MIEATIISYLSTALSVSVSGEIPEPMPAVFVTVEKTGSSELDHIKKATLAVQSWSGSQAEAAALNEEVKAAMNAALTLDSISRIHCESDYNFTDTMTRRNRYQAVFEVVYYDN